MLDAVRAEALKLRRHRATWMMVWIYPIAITLIVAGMLVYGAFRAHGVPAPAQPALEWIRESTTLWKLPASPPGRFLIAGFCAVVFAGEYGWNTWKLIIPARARWQLIAAKWVVALGFLTIALIAADLITLIGSWLGSFQGDGIPAGVTLAAVLEAHWQAGAHALLPIVYTIAFAGLFAILTQSILATVILSIALVVIEGLWPLIGLFLHQYVPALTETLVRVLPFYHLANLKTWASGAGLTMPLGPDAVVSMSWGMSFAVLMGWILAAAAATQLRFLRQDLN
ncbi:ABC-type transport system involved in multi-copper enzyme maturation permease subunit [Sphingomonas leidyi]|uniref:ABC-type transport system involved in multi-copper enzyme maturation permease subunit n=1 Tax=Sphingomonas leidyi TaxID=68569 RepID=A0A7X5V3K9_9SPHN|nr:ABC transporter permease [Sphingomonas leidyi]NIJ66706.1 ABC-type transport system involved in multi-copper enzyme maturation permease subunit [Sphingomonas leidyi]